jgi:hypothetical protein
MNVLIPTGSIRIASSVPDLKGYGISWITTCPPARLTGVNPSAVKLTGEDPTAVKLRGA